MEDTQRLYDEIVDKLMYDYIYNEDKYGKFVDIQLKKCNIDKNEFEYWKKKNKDSDKFVEVLRESYNKLCSTSFSIVHAKLNISSCALLQHL